MQKAGSRAFAATRFGSMSVEPPLLDARNQLAIPPPGALPEVSRFSKSVFQVDEAGRSRTLTPIVSSGSSPFTRVSFSMACHRWTISRPV